MSREEQDEAGAGCGETCTVLLPPCSASWSCCGLLPSLVSSLTGNIRERALMQCPEGRVAKSLLQNSLEYDVLAQLQGVMKRLLSVQTKRHVSFQPS